MGQRLSVDLTAEIAAAQSLPKMCSWGMHVWHECMRITSQNKVFQPRQMDLLLKAILLPRLLLLAVLLMADLS